MLTLLVTDAGQGLWPGLAVAGLGQQRYPWSQRGLQSGFRASLGISEKVWRTGRKPGGGDGAVNRGNIHSPSVAEECLGSRWQTAGEGGEEGAEHWVEGSEGGRNVHSSLSTEESG